MKIRNRLLCFLFTCFTAGLYSIYWFVSMTNASNKLAPKHKTAGGIAAWVLNYITLGCYGFYWSYRMGQKAGEMCEKESDGALYLILSLFTYTIVPMFLAQGAINDALKAR